MIESVEFKNFKALRATRLPLAPFTLILGPNGSGKSTALQAIYAAAFPGTTAYPAIASVGVGNGKSAVVEVALHWAAPLVGLTTKVTWSAPSGQGRNHLAEGGGNPPEETKNLLDTQLARIRLFSLSAEAIAHAVPVQPNVEMASNGLGFAAVLEQLRDDDSGRWEALNEEVVCWLPEYDRIILNTPSQGMKSVLLRTREGKHQIPAAQLSQGTLLALAMLTLAYLPTPPVFVGLEEPDRGLHPRLLVELRDALYRLSYPESCGEKRAPVQVVVTTHSPYMLDLYREHPEEIVLAQKFGLNVQFERLADKPHFEEILADAPLSEVWYSGILGGVPSTP